MNEIIERVAKAKWARRQEVAVKAGIHPPLVDWEEELEGLREEVRAEVRVAIAAMREPTAEIVKAHHVVPDDTDFEDRAVSNWRAMIDAALNEKKPDAG